MLAIKMLSLVYQEGDSRVSPIGRDNFLNPGNILRNILISQKWQFPFPNIVPLMIRFEFEFHRRHY